ncbi:MAG TPA: S46 family peptidase [Candidatus Angelobacter sp.]|nr:S46 family peptidase [Candidatus Angelobacter sp.]
MPSFLRYALTPFLFSLTFATSTASADEGWWTFDNPPSKQLQERYGFTPTQEWLDHLRLSCVRLNDGGSGAFVSPHGLLLTNHHVARSQLQKNSSPQHDYLRDGFYAAAQEQEMKSPDLEVNVLVSLENVTARIQDALKNITDEKKALAARKEIIAQIERQSLQSTGLRSDIVILYQGGEYWLYRYKKYTDVRLVFAPEQQIAFFGGDPDNFSFPRYDLDMAIFRVYENGKPIASTNYLHWNAKGAADGELVFMAGHPGSTSRLHTMAQILAERDVIDPIVLSSARQRISVMKQYAAQGPEQARQAQSRIFGLENGVKSTQGGYNALLDPHLIAAKQAAESDFRKRVESKPEWHTEFGGAWDAIAAAESKLSSMIKPQYFRQLDSQLAGLALTIVRYVTEIKKPDGERLAGFHESELDSLRFSLFSPAPISKEMDQARLSGALAESLAQLGSDDEWVKTVLEGRSPDTVAAQLIQGTQLSDPKFRKTLVDGGEAAVATSTDPMIALARKIDPVARKMLKLYEDQVQSVTQSAGEKLGRARFLVYGNSVYPDGTFTLRLSYGRVAGYPMNGTKAPYKTTFYGLYDRAASFDFASPFELPARLKEARDKFDLNTALDFANSCDSYGGSSGSPVVNKKGELVGLNFDRNVEALGRRFVYQEETGRAIAVHSGAMIEALRKIYGAGALADELEVSSH